MQSTSKQVQYFLQEVCKEIRFKSIHEKISQELYDHIEDQKNEYINQGVDEETAILMAIEQMGDPSIVGKQLNKTHKPKIEWSILSISALLVLIGGTIQYFLSKVNTSNIDMFSHFLQYAPIGIAAFALMYFFDYTWIRRYSKLAFFMFFAITAAGFLISNKVNGSYIYVFHSPLLFIPAFAGIIYGFRNKGYLGIVYSGLFYVGVAFMCIMALSISSLVLVTVSYLIILTVSIARGFFGRNKKLSLAHLYVQTLIMFGLAIFTTAIMSPYGFARLKFIFGFDPLRSEYLLTTIRKLLSAAKPIGTVVFEGHVENISIERILSQETIC